VCTLLGRANGGTWVLASSSDDPYVVANQLVCATGLTYAYIAVQVVTDDAQATVPWSRMLTRGLNTAGLAYTYAYVHEPENEHQGAQRWPETLLSRCRRVGEAIEFMRGCLGTVLSGNYLLADAEGDAAALEVSRTALHVARHPQALVCTNVWATLSMVAPDRWGADTARDRSERARSLVAQPALDVNAIFRATRDHSDAGGDAERSYGVSICNHGRSEGTISGEVLDPEHRELWWTYGWPCGAPRGYESPTRRPWGRYLAFAADRVLEDGIVTALDGRLTPLGVRLLSGLEADPRS
jgi:hypothetical protein